MTEVDAVNGDMPNPGCARTSLPTSKLLATNQLSFGSSDLHFENPLREAGWARYALGRASFLFGLQNGKVYGGNHAPRDASCLLSLRVSS